MLFERKMKNHMWPDPKPCDVTSTVNTDLILHESPDLADGNLISNQDWQQEPCPTTRHTKGCRLPDSQGLDTIQAGEPWPCCLGWAVLQFHRLVSALSAPALATAFWAQMRKLLRQPSAIEEWSLGLDPGRGLQARCKHWGAHFMIAYRAQRAMPCL